MTGSIRLLSLSALLVLCIAVQAQKVKTVKGEYVYRGPDNVSLAEAKRIALERAKLQAIADAFGTVVSQSNATTVLNRDGRSQIDFMSVGGSEVRGEWIETIGEPKYSEPYYEEGMLILTVKVKGRVREITGAGIEIDARLLRNGTTVRHESNDFREGDDLYLYFKSPANGSLAVYLCDEANGQAYCLLPYGASTSAAYPVEHDREYVFFSVKDAPEIERPEVDEYTITASTQMEYNTVYVVFSPNMFAKANATATRELTPRKLATADFHKWLSACRNKDKDMVVKSGRITIRRMRN